MQTGAPRAGRVSQEPYIYGRRSRHLQQLAAALRGCRDLVWVKAELGAGALVVQQQAVHQWRDEGARRQLACEGAGLPSGVAMQSAAVHYRNGHEAACGVSMLEQQAVHEGRWTCPVADWPARSRMPCSAAEPGMASAHQQSPVRCVSLMGPLMCNQGVCYSGAA